MINMEEQERDIIDAAAGLFVKYGIKSITMDEVSRQLAVSKKTIYRYFKDKQELVEKALETLLEQQKCAIDGVMDRGLNALEELFEVYNHVNEIIKEHNPALEFDLQRTYPTLFKRMRENHRNNIYQATERNLVKGKKEGYYRKDLDAAVIAKLHVVRLENFMHNDIITVEELHSKKFFKEVFKYHLHGIVSTEGLNYVKSNYPEFLKK